MYTVLYEEGANSRYRARYVELISELIEVWGYLNGNRCGGAWGKHGHLY